MIVYKKTSSMQEDSEQKILWGVQAQSTKAPFLRGEVKTQVSKERLSQ
jgi:hypothetical protein